MAKKIPPFYGAGHTVIIVSVNLINTVLHFAMLFAVAKVYKKAYDEPYNKPCPVLPTF